jgi:hypothetical protein
LLFIKSSGGTMWRSPSTPASWISHMELPLAAPYPNSVILARSISEALKQWLNFDSGPDAHWCMMTTQATVRSEWSYDLSHS